MTSWANQKALIHKHFDNLINQMDIYAEELIELLDVGNSSVNSNLSVEQNAVHLARMQIIDGLMLEKACKLGDLELKRRRATAESNCKPVDHSKYKQTNSILFKLDKIRKPGQNCFFINLSCFKFYLIVFEFDLNPLDEKYFK